MRGAFARVLFAAVGSSALFVAMAAAERSGDWQITEKVDDVAKTKVFNVKLEAKRTAHDGLFLPPDALLQLVCLKGQPLIHVMFAFQVGSKADSEILYRFDQGPMQPAEARILRGLKIFVIEKKSEVKQFLDGLATALRSTSRSALWIRVARARSFAWVQRGIDLLTAYCKPASKKM